MADTIQKQRICVFQQGSRSAGKIAAITTLAGETVHLDIVTIDEALPLVIDDASPWIPDTIDADLVLDHLIHPDLTFALAAVCRRSQIPMIASGRKGPLEEALTPRTCCALVEKQGLGVYGQCFGMPAFDVSARNGVITAVTVLRGAPCGATWPAAEQIIGMSCEQAAIQIGLEAQYRCVADPAGWDPISGKSPVHIAGDLHKAALVKAMSKRKADS